MSDVFENIVEDFEFLDDWEDRYRMVIELGKAMDPMEEALKTASNKVDGCASQVWLAANVQGAGADKVLRFTGDSDALIVRGLIALLHALYNGQTLEAILKRDALGQFARLGLDQHLSAQRSNGLRSMIARIYDIAENEQEVGA